MTAILGNFALPHRQPLCVVLRNRGLREPRLVAQRNGDEKLGHAAGGVVLPHTTDAVGARGHHVGSHTRWHDRGGIREAGI
jgi:hypothetical protein